MPMEEATEENNNNDDDKGYFNSGGEEDFQSSSGSISPQLKQSCLQLLELHQNPNIVSNASAPSQLLQLLRRSPPHRLQPFFEYVFPLFFFLPFFLIFFFPCSVFSVSNWFYLQRLHYALHFVGVFSKDYLFLFPFNVKVGSFICFVVLFHV